MNTITDPIDIEERMTDLVAQAVDDEDYNELYRIADAYAEMEDMVNAHYVRGLAREAKDKYWAFDEARDEELTQEVCS